MAQCSSRPAPLEPSELGTKEYWETAYARELQNNAANPSDEGTIWFDDAGAEEKMLLFLEDLAPPPPRATRQGGDEGASLQECESLRVLDLGTGNGHMLFAMEDDGWAGEMVGVDYSAQSVELAEQIRRRRRAAVVEPGEGAQEGGGVRFVRWDMLKEDTDRVLRLFGQGGGGGFDIVLDKGTFDAISLSDEGIDDEGRRGCEVYPEKVRQLVILGGYLLITSCNWTEEELRKWFEGDYFAYHDTISYPSFTFGGQKGQSVSSVCFRRRNLSK